jgi:hypothetical protein
MVRFANGWKSWTPAARAHASTAVIGAAIAGLAILTTMTPAVSAANLAGDPLQTALSAMVSRGL